MSQRLPTNPTDLVDPNKRGGAYIADLERRVAEIERFAVDQASAAVAGVKSANVDVANGTNTAISFDAADRFDDRSLHNTSSNNTRFYAPTSGTYLLVGQIAWQAAAVSGTAALWIQHENGARLGQTEVPWWNTGSFGQIQQAVALERLTAGMYVELVAYQATGGARGIDEGSTKFFMARIGP
jgi:hypothetical protein